MTRQGRPATVLERAIVSGQKGVLDPGGVLWTLAAGEVIILDNGARPDAGFPDDPLVVSRGEVTLLPIFTHPDQLGSYAEGRTPVSVPAFELLRRLPPGVGLVVNPGNAIGLEIPEHGIRAFITHLLNAL